MKTYGPKMLPFLRNYILPTARSMGKDVLNDVVSGKSTLKKSLKKRGLQSVGKIAARVVARGSGARRGGGVLLKNKKKKKTKKMSGGGGGGGRKTSS